MCNITAATAHFDGCHSNTLSAMFFWCTAVKRFSRAQHSEKAIARERETWKEMSWYIKLNEMQIQLILKWANLGQPKELNQCINVQLKLLVLQLLMNSGMPHLQGKLSDSAVQHLKTKHPSLAKKDVKYFKWPREIIEKQNKRMILCVIISDKALEAFYLVTKLASNPIPLLNHSSNLLARTLVG